MRRWGDAARGAQSGRLDQPEQGAPMNSPRPFAIVTGASSGIGLELARQASQRGYDLLIAADRPLDEAVQALQIGGGEVSAVQVDLATRFGVDELFEQAKGRRIDALLANAGHGLGKGFL